MRAGYWSDIMIPPLQLFPIDSVTYLDEAQKSTKSQHNGLHFSCHLSFCSEGCPVNTKRITVSVQALANEYRHGLFTAHNLEERRVL